MGLRELKKEQTRQLIADTAWRLFAERDFDEVSVAEIARAAQVSEATVFNYFRTKEDLFYGRLEAFGARLIDQVSARDQGETVIAAFRRALLAEGGLLAQAEAGDPTALAQLRTVNRVIAASPALLAREQQAFTHNADALAALLAAETGAPAETGASAGAGIPGDLSPQVTANALMGAHRALIGYVRQRVLSGEELASLADDVRRLAAAAMDLLEGGLASYAPGPPGRQSPAEVTGGPRGSADSR
jgi:AcrR family transcriptional regulator